MLNYKYKLYRSKKNKRLHQLCSTAGFVWNHCIALQKRYYSLYGGYIGSSKLQKHIAKLRKKNPYWKRLNSQTVQEICQRVDKAYQRFFKKLADRPPRFKNPWQFKSFVLKQSGWSLKDNKLILNKIGTYKFSKSRNFKNVKRATVKRDSVGDFYLILTCDIKPQTFKRAGNAAIGVDFGLKTYLTLNTGKQEISPQFFKAHEKEIVNKNQILARKNKIPASKNRSKAKTNLAKSYRSMRAKRSDYQWKLAHELCRGHAFIAIETLNIESMKRLWGKKVSDLSHSSFIEKLEHIASKYGTIIQKVDKFFPSSKLCSECGHKHSDLKLSDREYKCQSCEAVQDRDLNAAKNIKAEGIRLYKSRCKTIPAWLE
jgi:putative transposase